MFREERCRERARWGEGLAVITRGKVSKRRSPNAKRSHVDRTKEQIKYPDTRPSKAALGDNEDENAHSAVLYAALASVNSHKHMPHFQGGWQIRTHGGGRERRGVSPSRLYIFVDLLGGGAGSCSAIAHHPSSIIVSCLSSILHHSFSFLYPLSSILYHQSSMIHPLHQS